MTRAHGAGRVVSVGRRVTEEDAHFVHGHRLDLLPSTHPHQQLMELQLMSVSVGQEGVRVHNRMEGPAEENKLMMSQYRWRSFSRASNSKGISSPGSTSLHWLTLCVSSVAGLWTSEMESALLLCDSATLCARNTRTHYWAGPTCGQQAVAELRQRFTAWGWWSEWRTTWCIPCGCTERTARMAASSWTA